MREVSEAAWQLRQGGREGGAPPTRSVPGEAPPSTHHHLLAAPAADVSPILIMNHLIRGKDSWGEVN